MNERIDELMIEAGARFEFLHGVHYDDFQYKKFAQLIVEECRTVINDVYHKTPLELCGPLLTVDEEIMNHFYGVEKLT
jgi:hypothetical protein